MKKQLLLTAMAVLCLSVAGFSQTKGTNALSFGVNVTTDKTNENLPTESTTKNSSFSLGYGYFIQDNSKIGVELSYGTNKYNFSGTAQETKSYGGNVSYQRYFPLFKTLFAYAGGKAAYTYGKLEESNTQSISNQDYTSNQYAVGAYGGITWFLSKRFALETNLLSADILYSEINQSTTNTTSTFYTNKRTTFNFKSEGFINNLGFKIYVLF
ncbi:hypothetical protein DHW03_06845 [Pedobacter yonginense]|uniref:Outer membrane protein beta-barrel domain-containing protein n=1 Tax=Pedobacter yonginense TaxID=651869 RepID=A0A317ERI2_9SPHI|nr:outer membrane beta-barrel protein [Pedobacter yonginense]PWS29521.1 hypothetical protein DHW03_06845 [Pedobacter yonginense]